MQTAQPRGAVYDAARSAATSAFTFSTSIAALAGVLSLAVICLLSLLPFCCAIYRRRVCAISCVWCHLSHLMLFLFLLSSLPLSVAVGDVASPSGVLASYLTLALTGSLSSTLDYSASDEATGYLLIFAAGLPALTISAPFSRAGFFWLAHVWRHPPCAPPATSMPVIGYSSVAVASASPRAPTPERPATLPAPAPCDVVATSGGWHLHLSPRSNTGYEGVAFLRARRGKQYRARAPGKVMLGYFATAVAAAECYARHLGSALQLDVPSTFEYPSGATLQLHLSASSPVGFWGVTLVTSRPLRKLYLARLGPARADWVGYYATALEAAVAVTEAVQARDELLRSLLHSFDDPSGLDLTFADAMDAAEPAGEGVALAPTFGLGGAVAGPLQRVPTTGAGGAAPCRTVPAMGASLSAGMLCVFRCTCVPGPVCPLCA